MSTFQVNSVCQHGPTSTLITHLKPLLTTYQAHYMAGHDHCMEHIVESGYRVKEITRPITPPTKKCEIFMGINYHRWKGELLRDWHGWGVLLFELQPQQESHRWIIEVLNIKRRGLEFVCLSGSVQWYIASNNAPKTVDAGFSSFTITKTSMTVSYYDQAGNVLYTTPSIAPRT